MPFSRTLLAVALTVGTGLLHGAADDERQSFFENKIRPVLAAECYECHGATKQKGGLRLDYRDGILNGGESGAAVVAGDPEKSLIFQSIAHAHSDLQMPKDRAKLDDKVIADFAKWIKAGALDPRDHAPTAEEAAKDMDWKSVLEMRKRWWCFQPVTHPAPPAVKNAAMSHHPVDRFVEKKVEDAGLQPSGHASAAAIIRRASYILTGLAPTPAEVAAFEQSATRDPKSAMESLIERLLASPRFGETWARHWMDWMRYAETHGSEGDPQIPDAWRYRDYLIRAINADVPYPQMVCENIAGDLLKHPRINKELGQNESALGVGQYRFVLHGFGPTDTLDEQVTFTDNQIDVITKAFQALTVSCARCHNHKFDAISQTDFYALYGIMASCHPATICVDTPEVREKNVKELAALKPRIRDAVAAAWQKTLGDIPARLDGWKPKEEERRKGAGPDPGREALEAWARMRDLDKAKWKGEWSRQQRIWEDALAKRKAFEQQDTYAHWDLRGNDANRWFADGNGLRGPSAAGEFSVAPEGDQIIARLHPAGVFTDLLSTKHRGVFTSHRFQGQGGRLWVRVSGAGNSRVRYVVQNYPRTGTIHLKKDLDGEESEWVSWNIDYWKGDTLYLEACTNADMPVEGKGAERSWFGISEVVYSKDKDVPPPPPGVSLNAVMAPGTPAPASRAELAQVYARTIGQCVEAWRTGHMTDDQAEFLNAVLQAGLLPNTFKELAGVAPLVADYRKLEAEVPVPTRAPGVLEADAYDQALFVRGNHKTPADAVPRRFLEAIDPRDYKPANSGRLQLAQSLTDPKNPLTSRVIVNRLWHYVFGRGIVATTDNFGKLGDLPTHPELLDYLASHFDGHGGSIKEMLKFLLTSQTFQLDDHAPAQALEKDPENLLLTHFSVRRLDAEAVRDSILALTGKLDDSMYGEPVLSREPRRSVYLKVIRNNLDPFLSVFDAPVPSSTRGRRDSTNVPAQSLALLNDSAVIEWSGDWAKRMMSDKATPNDAARIHEMFLEAFGHPPTAQEKTQCVAYLHGIDEANSSSGITMSNLQKKISLLEGKIENCLGPVRDKLMAERGSAKVPGNLPAPMAEWDFEDGPRDLRGGLNLELKGNARVEHGALVLDGDKSYAESSMLTKPLREKTLEAWVQLDTLDQRGGGLMSVQTSNGATFDGIVFAEKEPRCWLAGSNFFRRTQSFGGEEEAAALTKPVHVALVYRADGTVAGYHRGAPYGQPYRSHGPEEFEAGRCNVVFGLRHSPAGGNKMLRGRILRARLYDRALSDAEISASAKLEAALPTDEDLLALLDESERKTVRHAREELSELNLKLTELRQATAHVGPEAAWQSLAQSLVNLKEFIYLR
jgi:cytochrome c553